MVRAVPAGPQEPIPTGYQPCPLIEVHRPSMRQADDAVRLSAFDPVIGLIAR